MVGKAPPRLVEEIVPLSERVLERTQVADVHVGRLGEPIDPGVEGLRLVHVERLVGPEGRIDFRGATGLGDGPVVGEVVGGIVGGAERAHVESFEQAPRREFGLLEQGIGLLPDGGRGLLVEQGVDAEVALQFQVGPVVERIAQRVRDRPGEGEEFLVGIGIAGAERFRGPVAAHRAPLVVIALQPDLVEVGELPVRRDVGRRQVIVVVEDGLRRREVVVEAPGRLGLEQEMIVDEGGSHFPTS